jgi:hypothetical protein
LVSSLPRLPSAPNESASAPAWSGAGRQSIVDLAAAISARFGGQTGVGPETIDDPCLAQWLRASAHVVLLVFDGLGDRQLRELSGRGALMDCHRGVLRSVFPSSTAPAITSFATALHPVSHANPGWFCWSDEVDAVIRTLPMDVRGAVEPQAVPESIWDWRSASESCGVPVIALQPAHIADSSFSRVAWSGATRVGYRSLTELRQSIVRAVRATPGGAFVWAYLPQFDTVSHQRGWQSDSARKLAGGFDSFFEALLHDLRADDALLIGTADHGFIDVNPRCRLRLEDFPDIVDCLHRPLCGEPRVAFCHVMPSQQEVFARRVESGLGFAFQLWKTPDLIEAGWFGPGQVSARLLSRIGTHALIARDGYTLVDCLPGEAEPDFIGMHGGIHPDEMRVPLVAARAGRPL